MKIIIVQFDIQWRNATANFLRVQQMLANIHCKDALVVLPELFATGFDVKADHSDLELVQAFLKEQAIKLECVLMGSAIGIETNGLRQNLSLVYNAQGECICQYQKIYPFSFGGESKRFSSGEKIQLFSIDSTVIAPFICYDLRFPEVFRHATLQGSQIITVQANWPLPRQDHWLTLLKARAIENQCFIIGVNRVGSDAQNAYGGASVVYSPQGECLVLGSAAEECIELEIDVKKAEEWRNHFPALQDIKKNWLGFLT